MRRDSNPAAVIVYLMVVTIAVIVLLLFLMGCAPAPAEQQSDIPRVDEHSDCDAEDFRNKEAECGFSQTSKKPKTTRASPKRTR